MKKKFIFIHRRDLVRRTRDVAPRVALEREGFGITHHIAYNFMVPGLFNRPQCCSVVCTARSAKASLNVGSEPVG